MAYDAEKWKSMRGSRCGSTGNLVQTTVGRVILSEVLPPRMPFADANKLMTKKEMTKLIDAVYRQAGHRETVNCWTRSKTSVFDYATRAGISICIDNMHIPTEKGRLDR